MTETYVNPYFAHNNPDNDSEQELLHGFFEEAVQQTGYKMAYIKRDLNDENIDTFFGENNLSVFNDYFHIEMYIATVDQFEGQGDLMSLMGVNVKDQVRLEMSRNRFIELSDGLSKPREGDLIYFPFNKNLFEIKFTEDEEQFYPLATLPTFKIVCELFDYSSQRFQTGNEDLDHMFHQSNDVEELDSLDKEPDYDDTKEYEDEGHDFIDPGRNKNVWGEFGE